MQELILDLLQTSCKPAQLQYWNEKRKPLILHTWFLICLGEKVTFMCFIFALKINSVLGMRLRSFPSTAGWVAQAWLFYFPAEISCGPPAHVENAIARGVHYQYGDMITYSCYSGYMLEGPLRSVCLESGNWTSPPICRGKTTFEWLFLSEAVEKCIWKSDMANNQYACYFTFLGFKFSLDICVIFLYGYEL